MKKANLISILSLFLILLTLVGRVAAQGTTEARTSADSLNVLPVENTKTHKRFFLGIGQTVRYKLRSSTHFVKDRITGIGRGTISFQNSYKLIATSAQGVASNVVPGVTVKTILKTQERIEKIRVERIDSKEMEGVQYSVSNGKTSDSRRTILIKDILVLEEWDSTAREPGTAASVITMELFPIPRSNVSALKIQRKKERRVTGTILTSLGAVGLTGSALILAGNGGSSGGDASGVGAASEDLALIAGGISVPMVIGGIALVGDKKIDMASWTFNDLESSSPERAAREYQKFKAGLSVGYALSPADATSGTLITLEPSYRISSNVTIGFRFENPAIKDSAPVFMSPTYCSPACPPVSAAPEIFPGSVRASFTLNTQYYFSSDKVMPFLGAGLGVYTFSAAGAQFGFYPRVGLDVGHFSFSLDYNYVPSVTYDYLGIRIGFFAGGGIKK